MNENYGNPEPTEISAVGEQDPEEEDGEAPLEHEGFDDERDPLDEKEV